MRAGYVIIRNRTALEPESGWIHIVPKGELPNSETGLVQVLDDAALDAIMAGIARDRQRLGNRWPGVYAGEEHFIYDETKSSAAFAWFKDFEKRSDGIWASESGLTDLGMEAVKNRRFKFTSFVADGKQLQPLGEKRVRIVGIETVGFTNYANGRELLSPMRNRGADSDLRSEISQMEQEFRRGLGVTAGSEQTTKGQKKSMKTVAAKLGLSADAAEEAVLAEVTKIMNRATDAEGKVATLTGRVTALETQNQTLLGEQIDADLAARGVTEEKVLNRVKPVLTRMENRADRLGFLDDMGFTAERKDTAGAANAATSATGKVFNRSDAKSPEKKGGETNKAGDGRAAADRIMNRATELKGTTPSRSFESCWNQAQREEESKK